MYMTLDMNALLHTGGTYLQVEGSNKAGVLYVGAASIPVGHYRDGALYRATGVASRCCGHFGGGRVQNAAGGTVGGYDRRGNVFCFVNGQRRTVARLEDWGSQLIGPGAAGLLLLLGGSATAFYHRAYLPAP